MNPVLPIQKSKKKFSKSFIIIIAIIITIVLGWAGLTKAGFIEIFLYFDILEPFTFSSNNTGGCTYNPDGEIQCVAKPVIYLYPTQKQDVSVKLDYQGKFTVTYPEYNNGWNVTAYPDSKIINKEDGKEYSYLFWEGEGERNYDLSKGFVIEGEKTSEFLQNKLAELGLTPKEYNEFIVYWMPKMLHNKYNLIHFASQEEYDDKAKLDINPKPDSMLRVFMVFKPLESKVDVTPQDIKSFERKGFTVVEWGGTELE